MTSGSHPSTAGEPGAETAGAVADEQSVPRWDSEQVVKDQAEQPAPVGGGWSGSQVTLDHGEGQQEQETGGWNSEEVVRDHGDTAARDEPDDGAGSGQPGENRDGRSGQWSGDEVRRDAGEGPA